MCYPMLESDSRRMGVFSRLSRFVAELPEDLYERWSLEEDTSPAPETGAEGDGAPDPGFGPEDVPDPGFGPGPEDVPDAESAAAAGSVISRPADPDDPGGLRYEYDEGF